MEETDTLEQASPVTGVVVERNEEFYDQSYVNDKEDAASEVSLSHGQGWTPRHLRCGLLEKEMLAQQ